MATTTTTTPIRLPADVESLMASTGMTERARRLFVAARPEVESPARFARSCGGAEGTVVEEPNVHTRGCFVGGRIHLRASERAEAGDLLTVVAAHELLHAVYASLSPGERARIDPELEVARTGNTRLEERLRPYGGGPTLANEVHSILGSEFDGLSPALEAHYALYFADRSRITAARQRTLGAREDEIDRLKAVVADLDGRIRALQATQDRLLAAGDIRAYNANVAAINALIDRHNSSVDALNALIADYNSLLGD